MISPCLLLFLSSYDTRLLAPIVVDFRVSIIWDTDMTDVELEVWEPSGEKCNSFHNKSESGGMISRNFSHGYGPEEYLARNAQHGKYQIWVKLFSSMQKYTGTTILVKIWAYFGDPTKEEEVSYSVRLQNDRESCHVADVVFSY